MVHFQVFSLSPPTFLSNLVKFMSPKLRSGKKICLPAQEMQETQVPSLGQGQPLEEEMATHSSILDNPINRVAW